MNQKIRNNIFAAAAGLAMAVIFVINLVISRDCNRLMVMLTGGGALMDSMGATPATVFKSGQIFRLVTYGYLHPAIWHLAGNVCALWYVGAYLQKAIGTVRMVIVYHCGLIAACAAFLLIFPDGLIYGASPAIYCCRGMMATWLLRDRSLSGKYRNIRGSRYLMVYLILPNFIGLGTFVVHLLGFCAGLLLGLVVRQRALTLQTSDRSTQSTCS